ncbi:GNAT family N-acetyltransferase [Myroides fluvii]|uniref:GNAT family N-acetyltransferase n=1 Tax=Myroides fluvii TaxID=2572594 RepID=UPI00131D6DBE|nr:GNAT family protein [Myroides fluvii]
MKHSYSYSIDSLEQLPFVTESERTLGETIAAARRGETTWSTVLAQLESLDPLSVIYLPLVESLCADFKAVEDPLDREVQLRLWIVLLHKMGRHWTTYRSIAKVEKEEVNEWDNLLQIVDEPRRNALIWCQLLVQVLEAKAEVQAFADLNLIQEGMRMEMLMIVEMLEPQERKIFPVDQQWQTESLWFRKIETADQALLQRYFTPAIGQYLSIDSFAHPVLVQEYIRQSSIEMQQGTCLVLLVFEQNSTEFVGCLTLNDMNRYTVEIGLWVAEDQQGKGYGAAMLDQALVMISQDIPTAQIIYTVEKENHKSIALCEKKGFQLECELILEPTPLKNKYRTMFRFTKQVVAK